MAKFKIEYRLTYGIKSERGTVVEAETLGEALFKAGAEAVQDSGGGAVELVAVYKEARWLKAEVPE